MIMFDFNEREILRYLGHHGQEVPENVEQLIKECESELDRVAVPRSFWREYPLTMDDTEIDMTVMRTESRNLRKNLQDCQSVLLFAATLGSGVDMLLQRYGRLQMSKCVVLQAAAASMLETYCDTQNEKLRQEYLEQGLYLRPRFSPGYGDFPLECQTALAGALELNKRIGITLTDSLLMAPSKSVTAVIGISRIPRTCTIHGCEACGKTDCAYRR
jgi:hypothetical protein